jgi:predicted lysophospholipase L1 biosynthesis ABC-type transport system permease subunit
MSVLKPIKGFIGVLVGSSLGGAAIQAVGNIGSGMSTGMKSATQSMVGVGVMSQGAKLIPKKLKW